MADYYTQEEQDMRDQQSEFNCIRCGCPLTEDEQDWEDGICTGCGYAVGVL